MPMCEAMFCSQQINIPPELPDILKKFTKAAIRMQPHDVLWWSAGYFGSLSKGEILPMKAGIEMPIAHTTTNMGLTPELLKVLHKQLSSKIFVNENVLKQTWEDLCLPQVQLQRILKLDNFGSEVEWMKFLALACSTLGATISNALETACEILTEDSEGSTAQITFKTFIFLYKYLAQIDGDIPQRQVEETILSLQAEVCKQEGLIQPRNFLSVL
ncbi:ropporin-1-like protein isoform X2 [Hyperolius riggenbachi]